MKSRNDHVSCALQVAKVRQARYYNVGTKDRPQLAAGQMVHVKVNDTSKWQKGEVLTQLPYQSYRVRLDRGYGTVRQRSSKHVRFLSEPAIGQTPLAPLPPPLTPLSAPPSDTPSTVLTSQTCTRSGRRVGKLGPNSQTV